MNKNEFVNDYKDSKKGYLITIIIFSIILIVLLGIYIGRKLTSEDDNNTNVNNSTETQKSNEEKQGEKEEPKKQVLWDNKKSEPEEGKIHEIYIQNNGIYLNEKLIANNIKDHLNVRLGSDICEGNFFIVYIKENNTVGAISIDNLVCGVDLEYIVNIDEIQNINKIYKELKASEEGIDFYSVYVDTDTENKIEINNYLLN